jgi:rhodanese-related sulfurtransferase
MRKAFFQNTLIAIIVFSCAYAFNSDQNRIQDTKAAFQYFENEINFKANARTVLTVSLGKAPGVIVDVRDAEAFKAGHIPGAIHIPFGQKSKPIDFSGLSKDKINYVYCYSLHCNLSQMAAKTFAAHGYPVKEIQGGFDTWKEENYPIEK